MSAEAATADDPAVAEKGRVVSDLVDDYEAANPPGQIASSGSTGWDLPLDMGSSGDLPAGGVTTPEPMADPVGDMNRTRAAISEQGVAGLADDAAAAEEELNWINRMMRDKLGMTDASQRAKAAQALISFGSGVLASGGDSWQAIGEGIQAASGAVNEMNDEEAAALAAQQEAILDENRWRAEMALKELQAYGGGKQPAAVETINSMAAQYKELYGVSDKEAFEWAIANFGKSGDGAIDEAIAEVIRAQTANMAE